jgi:hypothetical protein
MLDSDVPRSEVYRPAVSTVEIVTDIEMVA